MEHRLKRLLTTAAVLALIAYSLPALQTGAREVSLFQQAWRLAGEFFPPDLSVLPEVLKALGETIRIATLATLIAVVVSVVFAVASSRATGALWSRTPARLILSAIRTIPSLVWAVIAVALIGPSPRAGVIALAFYSIGYLGKFFAEILDQADPRPARWLRSQGAHPWQVFQYALWPDLRGALGAQSLWMWEYNIRSASIIGYVGAGGLGLQLHVYQEFGQWDRFCTVLILIFTLVVGLEFLSGLVKKNAAKSRGG